MSAFTIIGAEEYGMQPRVISPHRTLKAAQRRWNRLERQGDLKAYKIIGILTEAGLVNYFGEPLIKSPTIGYIDVRMDIYHDA